MQSFWDKYHTALCDISVAFAFAWTCTLALPLSLYAQRPGTPDSAFGQAGWITLNMDDYDSPVALHANARRILVAANTGHADSAGYDMDILLAAFTSDGSLDPGFGTNGIHRFDFTGQSFSKVTAMTPMPNGGYSILGYGQSHSTAGRQYFCIHRVDSLGNPDVGFGINGQVALPFIGNYNIPEAILAQPDGKLLVVGSTYDSTLQHIEYPCIARLNPDGGLDSSFGGTGQLLLNYATGLQHAKVTHSNGGSFYDVALLPDGRILCAGSALGSSGYNCALLMLQADGSADTTFHENGILAWDNAPGCNNYVKSVTPLADGSIAMQILVDCWYLDADQYYQRLPENGQPGDLISLDGGLAEQALTMLDDGKGHLYFTGPAKALGQPNGWYSDRYSMCRVEASNGILDADFGNGGWFQAAPNAPEQSGAEALAIQGDGKVLVGGFVNTGMPGNLSDIGLVRLLGGTPLAATAPVDPARSSILAYPNPCRGVLHVDLGEGHYVLSLVGMDGQVKGEWEVVGKGELDLSGVAAGVYLLRGRGRNGVETMRIVVE